MRARWYGLGSPLGPSLGRVQLKPKLVGYMVSALPFYGDVALDIKFTGKRPLWRADLLPSTPASGVVGLRSGADVIRLCVCL